MLRQHLRGWAKNVSGTYKKEKKQLLNKLNELDKKAESNFLEQHEIDLKQTLNNHLAELLREEELKWYQRAKVKNLLEYRPICLLNVSFKIFTKVITNRVTTVAHKIISPTQSAFSARKKYYGRSGHLT